MLALEAATHYSRPGVVAADNAVATEARSDAMLLLLLLLLVLTTDCCWCCCYCLLTTGCCNVIAAVAAAFSIGNRLKIENNKLQQWQAVPGT